MLQISLIDAKYLLNHDSVHMMSKSGLANSVLEKVL